MPRLARFSTVDHLDAASSRFQFECLQKKWPQMRADKSDHKWLDLSNCKCSGSGDHEVIAFTFARHLRGGPIPIWLGAGAHWSDRWHDAQGLPYRGKSIIEVSRGFYEKASFVEPLAVLAIGSAPNGQALFDRWLSRCLNLGGTTMPSLRPLGNPRFTQLRCSIDTVLQALEEVVVLTCEQISPVAPVDTGGCVSITIDGLEDYARKCVRFVTMDCPQFGSGKHVLYAYTYQAFLRGAESEHESAVPIKVGWTATCEDWPTALMAAEIRISSQVALPEPVAVIALRCCESGRKMESAAHRFFQNERLRSPAREWFMLKRSDVRSAFLELSEVSS